MVTLQSSYDQLRAAIAIAQAHALRLSTGHLSRAHVFLELERANGLANGVLGFARGGDPLTKDEVAKMGEVMVALKGAAYGMRANPDAGLRESEEHTHDVLSGAIHTAQRYARTTAAHAFRCRASEFIFAVPSLGKVAKA